MGVEDIACTSDLCGYLYNNGLGKFVVDIYGNGKIDKFILYNTD